METLARPPSGHLTLRLDDDLALMKGAHARFLTSVAEFDQQRAWEQDGATSMTGWLAARYGLARRTAREFVRVARALRELPRIRQAYENGSLSWDQLQPLTRFATAETDQLLAKRAPMLRPVGLWREARRHQRMLCRDAEEAHRRRSVAIWRDPELPVVYVAGTLPAEQGEAVRRSLVQHVEQTAREVRLAGVPFEARMADALVELVAGRPGGEGAQPVLVVHAAAEVLAGREPAEGAVLAETEGGGRLAAETVRRLACDSRVEWVLEHKGRPVGTGRQGRAVPGAGPSGAAPP